MKELTFNQAAKISADPVKYGKYDSAKALSYFAKAKRTATTEQFKFECDIAVKRIIHRIAGDSNEHICNKRKSCSVCKGAL